MRGISSIFHHPRDSGHVPRHARESRVHITGRVHVVPHGGLVILHVDVDGVAARLDGRASGAAELEGVVIVELDAVLQQRGHGGRGERVR